MKKLGMAFIFALAACGGADTPATNAPAGNGDNEHAAGEHVDGEHKQGEHKHANDEKHEHKFGPTLTAFHDTMSPLWHAEPGDKRTADTCAAITKLQSDAAAVVAAPSAEMGAADPDAWPANTKSLSDSVDALAAVCADESKWSEFDSTFKAVHDAFHVLIDKKK